MRRLKEDKQELREELREALRKLQTAKDAESKEIPDSSVQSDQMPPPGDFGQQIQHIAPHHLQIFQRVRQATQLAAHLDTVRSAQEQKPLQIMESRQIHPTSSVSQFQVQQQPQRQTQQPYQPPYTDAETMATARANNVESRSIGREAKSIEDEIKAIKQLESIAPGHPDVRYRQDQVNQRRRAIDKRGSLLGTKRKELQEEVKSQKRKCLEKNPHKSRDLALPSQANMQNTTPTQDVIKRSGSCDVPSILVRAPIPLQEHFYPSSIFTTTPFEHVSANNRFNSSSSLLSSGSLGCFTGSQPATYAPPGFLGQPSMPLLSTTAAFGPSESSKMSLDDQMKARVDAMARRTAQ